jgi:hypothetical protein
MATEKIILSAVDQTRAAFQSVQGNISRLTGSLRGIAGPLAAAFSVGAITSFAKSLIDAADRLRDLSEETGISAEQLSKFGNAAQLNGSSAEQFQTAIVKFSNAVAEAGAGTQAQIDAFNSLGVSIKDVNGNLRPTIEIFKDVANRYAQTADGAGKLAVTQDLFGRGASKLIPTLNQGAASLEKYQATFSNEFIDASAKFNDEIDKLSINFQRLASTNLTGLIQAINKMLNPESVTYAEKLSNEIQRMQGVMTASVGTNFLERILGIDLGSADAKAKIEQAQELLREVRRMEAASQNKPAADKPAIVVKKTDMTPLDELVERNKKIIELLDKGRTPIQKYQEALAELEAMKVGLSDDAYLENLMRINEEYENAQPKIVRNKTALEQYAEASRNLGQQLDNFAVSALTNLEDALLGVMMGTMSVKDAFKSMASSIISDLLRIYIQRSITGPIADALFGSLPSPGSSSGTSLGTGLTIRGSNAIGGSVQSGSPYMVGERGPEMFIPNASGSIVPNDRLGGSGGTTVVNLNISTGVAQTVRAEIQSMMPRITEATKAAVADAKRRGGTYGKMMA